MEDLARAEYPALLANLQPNQAVQALNDRVKRITKVNNEIADWLQERRKVEEQYVQGLRRLIQFRVPNMQSELGSFQPQWDKILQSADSIATSHHRFATKIEKDVETPLRSFGQKKEMSNMQNIQGNLFTIAKELEEAQDKSDKLSKKGGKASAAKVDAATGRLEAANQQWESQAPFVFETLQALDETRMNQLRDCLTQYGTYEGEQAQRHQADSENMLNGLLDYDTAREIENFVTKTTLGKPKLERRSPAVRQSSSFAGSAASSLPQHPSINLPPPDDDRSDQRSEYSGPKEAPSENRLRSRIGTMLGRRRQSIHGGFGQLSPSKGPFGRNTKSSQGLSPKPSSSNLGDSSQRMGSLAEDPDVTEENRRPSETQEEKSHDGTNGIRGESSTDTPPAALRLNGMSASADVSEVPPPPGPPPSQKAPEKDADGFTVPPAMNDPISQAEKEAAGQESDQHFKLNIQNEPVSEEDPEAKKAAISNVANSLSAMGLPSRKAGTVRGRRDVRNTIYVPSPVSEGTWSENPFHSVPGLTPATSKTSALATLASESSVAGTSDTQSIRSGNSLSSIVHVKHPDMHEPGLNTSVMETISATFEGGDVKTVGVNGEIAFCYNTSDASSLPTHVPIRVNNFPALEVIGPNRIFVTNHTPDHPDQFTLDTSHLQKTAIGFSYKLHINAGTLATEHVPILIKPAWKPQGDKLGLLLQYKLNPAFKFAANEGTTTTSSVQIHNLVLFATYEGGRSSGAQTKPQGTHLKDRRLVYWRLGDVTLSRADDVEWQRIVCRIVGEQGAEPRPGTVEARWEFNPPPVRPSQQPSPGGEGDNNKPPVVVSVSRFEEGKGKEVELSDDDPFADDSVTNTTASSEGRWLDVPTTRKLISGNYEAK